MLTFGLINVEITETVDHEFFQVVALCARLFKKVD